MRDHYSLALRIISTIVLSFFCWTFGGVFDIAYAVKDSSQLSTNGQQTSKANQQTKKENRPEEKFGKDMGDIENILKDDKSDRETKKSKIKSKRAEIDADDVEIKKQFKDTKDKIKNLPEVIKKRHRDFVKKYDDNLKEFKANLDEIDKAKTNNEKDLSQKKAKDFLEKVKPPKKHQALDPNKLPHRTEEPVFKEPRTKPEEFKEGKKLNAMGTPQKPLLIASNGSLSGLISKKTASESLYDFPEGSYQIALANPPTSADLAETIEVQFTPGITAKATELEHNPVKIYNWVRNNIEYVPTYGSIQGANMCLQTKLCNDFDTASLLIALLRASGIHARYVYGTIELPIEKVKNWVGGFTDSNAALNLIATGGIPVGGLTEGGKIVTVRKEEVWVEAFIDYFPSRGARHKNGKGSTWIPLDASFKQYAYTAGMDIKTAVPFDAQSFVNQVRATATINVQTGYVTGINSTLIQQTMTDYQTRVQNYISQNYPNATVGDVLGKKDIVKQEFPYLLGTLPYKTVTRGAIYSNLSDSLRHKASFNMTIDNQTFEMSLTKSLPELAGKKITLSYAPATSQDEAVINSYLPTPHVDGTPIQPSELPSSLPAYLINLKPELRIDGVVVATGNALTMGQNEFFNISISAPTTGTHSVSNKVTAGEYNAIGLNNTKISAEQMTALKAKLEATKAKLKTQNFTEITEDDILGDLLYTTILSYFAELDTMDYVSAKTMGVYATRLPSVGRFFNALAVDYMWGMPVKASSGGLSMDIGLARKLVKAPDGSKDMQIQFMLTSGMNSSALEHSVPERLFSTADKAAQGISAVKALQLANEQGIPIYNIDQANIEAILPWLQLDSTTITDIQNAVSTGKVVTVSKTNITYNGWTGCGYIIVNPNTGAGAYMISGGLSGGWMASLYFVPVFGTALLLYDNSEFILDLFGDMYSIAICTVSVLPFTSSCKEKCDATYGADRAAEYRWCVAKALILMGSFKGAEKGIEQGLIATGALSSELAELVMGVVGILVLEVEILFEYGGCNAELHLNI